MSTESEDSFSWLPDHQLHVLASLGYVDDLLADLARLLRDHSRRGAFELVNVVNGDIGEVRIAGLRPIPPAVSRLTSDVLGNLRNALEHTLFAAVEHDLGRPMSRQEARSIEVPACDSETTFDTWLADKRRAGMSPLHAGASLALALRRLQPFTWTGTDASPLGLLVEHTNASKHRAPTLAQVQLAQVTPARTFPGLIIPALTGEPAAVGDLVASGPGGIPVELDIWPTISIFRPVTSGWKTLQRELSDIEEWVRATALPALLGLGDTQRLPATVDVRAEVDDLRKAADDAIGDPAMVRNTRILMAEGVARPRMLIFLIPECRTTEECEAVRWWTSTLTDEQIIARHDRLRRASTDDPTAIEACRQVIKVAVLQARMAKDADTSRP